MMEDCTEKGHQLVRRLLEEKIEAIQHLLDSLLREVSADEQKLDLIQALTTSLEELNLASLEIQKQNNELLASSQRIAMEHERYQELFEITPNGYLVTDIQGRIQEANPTASRLLNAPQHFLIDKPLKVFIEGTQLQKFLPVLHQVQQDKQNLELETILQPRQKPPFPGLLYVVRAYNSSEELIGLLWLIHDITTIKHQEEERLYLNKKVKEHQLALESSPLLQSELHKLSKLKSNFLSSISHELKSPVSNIKLALGTLKSYLPTDTKSERLLDILNKECNREIRLIEKLLLIQSEEEKTTTIQLPALELIQLSRWLPPILQPYYEQTEKNNIKFAYGIEKDLDEFIVDTKLLKEVILEILDNACKHTPEDGFITVHVRKGDNSFITHPTQSISITNNGPKIPNEQLCRIFETFYRIPGNDPYEYSGLGIGLSLAMKSIQKLGATLRVKSSYQSTVFTIELRHQSMGGFSIDESREDFEFVSGVIITSSVSSVTNNN